MPGEKVPGEWRLPEHLGCPAPPGRASSCHPSWNTPTVLHLPAGQAAATPPGTPRLSCTSRQGKQLPPLLEHPDCPAPPCGASSCHPSWNTPAVLHLPAGQAAATPPGTPRLSCTSRRGKQVPPLLEHPDCPAPPGGASRCHPSWNTLTVLHLPAGQAGATPPGTP
ncbi:proline-rich protein 36-like isoform X2 [Eriocheir sinensis]|uniref:proline-rich protein 36-like isoform X2 n=1 Tax=Eriocheir sinensis TaxID=95602 RepID=UPI0021C8B78D|nr:proline-rich protein 36-like isoform X2 [Eriocheir sinensis]